MNLFVNFRGDNCAALHDMRRSLAYDLFDVPSGRSTTRRSVHPEIDPSLSVQNDRPDIALDLCADSSLVAKRVLQSVSPDLLGQRLAPDPERSFVQ